MGTAVTFRLSPIFWSADVKKLKDAAIGSRVGFNCMTISKALDITFQIKQ
jgi:hypothetical protein